MPCRTEELRQKAKGFLFNWLFFRERGDLTIWEIIWWWEVRRLAFNAAVGLTGLVAVVVMTTTGCIMDANGYDAVGISDPPIFEILVIVLYALLANVCYTGGWVVELILRVAWPLKAAAFGRISLGIGLAGSVLLTLVPPFLTVIVAACEVIAKTPRTP